MQYRIRHGTALLATVSTKSYTPTGLTPNTSYTFSVTAYNGLRESSTVTVTTKTRGLRVTLPVALTVNDTVSLVYLEYPLGAVPIGTEPDGFFGGGNRQTVEAKVITVSDGTSTLETTSTFDDISDGLVMTLLDDGTYGAFDGVKALYYKGA